jgi:hypothetical protein
MTEVGGIFLVAMIYFLPGFALGWFTTSRRNLFRVGAPLIPLLVTVAFAFFSAPYILPGLLFVGMFAGLCGAFSGRHFRTKPRS